MQQNYHQAEHFRRFEVCGRPLDGEGTTELIGFIAFSIANIIITKRGKPFVALISVKDLEFLEKINNLVERMVST